MITDRIHLGDHCPEPHRNSAEHPEEHLVLLPLGVGQHRVAGLRPLVRTLQSGGIGCRASGLRRLGSHCVETKKPLDVRGWRWKRENRLLIIGDKHLGVEGSNVAEMLLVRAAQRERVFTGCGEHQGIGKLNAGFQRIFLNEDHGAM